MKKSDEVGGDRKRVNEECEKVTGVFLAGLVPVFGDEKAKPKMVTCELGGDFGIIGDFEE